MVSPSLSTSPLGFAVSLSSVSGEPGVMEQLPIVGTLFPIITELDVTGSPNSRPSSGIHSTLIFWSRSVCNAGKDSVVTPASTQFEPSLISQLYVYPSESPSWSDHPDGTALNSSSPIGVMGVMLQPEISGAELAMVIRAYPAGPSKKPSLGVTQTSTFSPLAVVPASTKSLVCGKLRATESMAQS